MQSGILASPAAVGYIGNPIVKVAITAADEPYDPEEFCRFDRFRAQGTKHISFHIFRLRRFGAIICAVKLRLLRRPRAALLQRVRKVFTLLEERVTYAYT
jgi:hypothetical protein